MSEPLFRPGLLKTGTKATIKRVATSIIETKPDTIKIISPHLVDISLHTHQVSLTNQESVILRVGHKTNKIKIDIKSNCQIKRPIAKMGKNRVINCTTIDRETGIAVVIVAIEPKTTLVKETIIGTVVVGKKVKNTSLMGIKMIIR